MRSVKGVVSVAILFAGLASASLIAAPGAGDRNGERALIDASRFRPMVAFHEVETVSNSEFVTLTGVVFSRSPLESVTAGDRAATLRPAESKDLVSLPRAPKGASELPFRTAFELPDAVLTHVGANDLDVVAVTTDGKRSDIHRLTVLRIEDGGSAQE